MSNRIEVKVETNGKRSKVEMTFKFNWILQLTWLGLGYFSGEFGLWLKLEGVRDNDAYNRVKRLDFLTFDLLLWLLQKIIWHLCLGCCWPTRNKKWFLSYFFIFLFVSFLLLDELRRYLNDSHNTWLFISANNFYMYHKYFALRKAFSELNMNIKYEFYKESVEEKFIHRIGSLSFVVCLELLWFMEWSSDVCLCVCVMSITGTILSISTAKCTACRYVCYDNTN